MLGDGGQSCFRKNFGVVSLVSVRSINYTGDNW